MSHQEKTPQTLAQKLIAKAAGRDSVEVGEIVNCGVDLAMFHDSSGPRRLKPMLEELGASVWDKSRIVLVMDHYVPERGDDAKKSFVSRATGRASKTSPMCTTVRVFVTWCCLRKDISAPACFALVVTRTRLQGARLARICSGSGVPRCSVSSSREKYGCKYLGRYVCFGTAVCKPACAPKT